MPADTLRQQLQMHTLYPVSRHLNEPEKRVELYGRLSERQLQVDYTVDQLRPRLLTWCRARKHLEHAASWTGIGVIANQPGTVAVLVQLDAPWTEDPDLDQLIETLQMRPYAEVATSLR